MFNTKHFALRYFNGLYFAPGLGVSIVGLISAYDPYAIIQAQARIATSIQEHGSFSEAELTDHYGVILPATHVVTIEMLNPGGSVQIASPQTEVEDTGSFGTSTSIEPSAIIE